MCVHGSLAKGGGGGLNPRLQPDTTLGSENTQIEELDENNDRVMGGASRGANLFHSFLEFNIETGKGVYFANPVGIENILARVTGDNISEILGTLGVLGNANLFFLNPNGILFGPNASLDLSGSFIGTTANSFAFADGSEFSATNPGVPPLVTVDVQQPIGLNFEGQQGSITNAGDLVVAFGQRLSLSGSDVVSTGNLTAPGGRVEVLGTERVALLENATIDVSAPTGGGTVLIGGDFQGKGTVPHAKRTYVGDRVTIKADALTNGNGGKVIVWADEVTGFYGSISARGGVDSGNGGLVEVSGKEHLIFRGQVDTSAVNGLPGTLLLDPTNITIADGSGDEAGDGTDTFAGNNSGVVGSILSAPLSEIDDTAPTTIYESNGAEVSAKTEGEGEAGNIVIIANTLEATSGSQIQTNTTTNSNAADITLRIRENLLLSGADSGLFAQTQGEGKAGNITINTSQLTINQGAEISALTEASGNGGTITINAPQTVLLTNNSKLTVETSSAGKAGNITITTPLLTIGKNAQLSATATETSTNPTAGNITLNVSQLNIAGELGIFAETQSIADAGNLTIQPLDTSNLKINFSENGFISPAPPVLAMEEISLSLHLQPLIFEEKAPSLPKPLAVAMQETSM